jgi:hypothetical protein
MPVMTIVPPEEVAAEAACVAGAQSTKRSECSTSITSLRSSEERARGEGVPGRRKSAVEGGEHIPTVEIVERLLEDLDYTEKEGLPLTREAPPAWL